MNDPLTPIHAATHHDPYPYYAGLVADQPIYYDQEMKMWVASSAEAVSAVLRSHSLFGSASGGTSSYPVDWLASRSSFLSSGSDE